MLDSLSYLGVLERGFALVRGADGSVRRRAAMLKAGESVSLTFIDGEAAATVGGKPTEKAKPKMHAEPTAKGQGSLL